MQFSKLQIDLTDQEIKQIHLFPGIHNVRDGTMLSTLLILNQEMRHAAAYNNSKLLLPIVGAFSILNQLGNCYSDSSKQKYPHSYASGVKKCLYYFSDYQANGADTKALYALRNSIVHDASLFSRDPRANNHHHFCFDLNQSSVVVLPQRNWNGSLVDVCDETVTLINPGILVDLANAAINAASNANDRGELSIELTEGSMELKHRYIRYIWAVNKTV